MNQNIFKNIKDGYICSRHAKKNLHANKHVWNTLVQTNFELVYLRRLFTLHLTPLNFNVNIFNVRIFFNFFLKGAIGWMVLETSNPFLVLESSFLIF